MTNVSATRLLVLGAVRIFQPVHGYDVRRELLSWHVDEWAHVAPGSIYHQLRALAGEGLLEVSGVEQQGGRPARTRYHLTDRGEDGFLDMLRRGLAELEPGGTVILAALSFLPMLPRAEAGEALERRRVRIEEFLGQAKDIDVRSWDAPEHVAEIVELSNARLRAEADWVRALAARLATGRYTMAGED